MLSDRVKQEILSKLTTIVNVQRVILFGSHAAGTAGPDSDIDLIVVTDDDSMPRSFEESMEHHHRIASALREIRKRIPMDLVVHTRPMHEEFIRQRSMFAKEISERGEILYEKGH